MTVFNISFLLGMLEAKASHERIYKYVKDGRAELREMDLETWCKEHAFEFYGHWEVLKIFIKKEILAE